MTSLKKKMKKEGGFTLIEMLIVVAIIAILVAVSIPMVNGALDKARKATDAANERSAKAAATIEYISEGKPAGTYYYDAANGKLVDSSDNLTYGKCDQHKKDCIQVVITAENTASKTPSKIEIKWKSGKANDSDTMVNQ